MSGEIIQEDDFVDDFLSHYGVKGMRWGVTTADVSTVGKLAGQATSFRANKTKTVFNQKVGEAGGLHSVSDSDLKKMLERMDMERRFSKFMSEESEKRAAGRKAAAKMLLKIGEIALPIIIGSVVAKKAAPTIFRTVSQYQKSVGR